MSYWNFTIPHWRLTCEYSSYYPQNRNRSLFSERRKKGVNDMNVTIKNFLQQWWHTQLSHKIFESGIAFTSTLQFAIKYRFSDWIWKKVKKNLIETTIFKGKTISWSRVYRWFQEIYHSISNDNNSLSVWLCGVHKTINKSQNQSLEVYRINMRVSLFRA